MILVQRSNDYEVMIFCRHSLLAETTPEDFSHENRVRMYMALDKIFNYFASHQVTTAKGP